MGKWRLVGLLIGTLAVSLMLALLVEFVPGGAQLPAVQRVAAQEVPLYRVFLPQVLNRYPSFAGFGVGLNGSTGLDEMAEAGATWARQGQSVKWSLVEPTEGARNWAALAGLDDYLRSASAKGVQTILIVTDTPVWAKNPESACAGPIKAEKRVSFGNFLKDLVARYSAPEFGVKYWELWNEPDVDPSLPISWESWGCNQDDYYGGGAYAEMLKVAHPQAKLANSEVQVLVGGLLLDCDPDPDPDNRQTCAGAHGTKPSRFLEGILRNGGGRYFDGISFHTYDYYGDDDPDVGPGLGRYYNPNWGTAWESTGPVSSAKARFLRSVLAQYGVSDKYLMNTESALLCDGPACDATYELTKAYYLAQLYATVVADDLKANFWYSALGWRNSGLLNTNLTPRPAYTAFQVAAKKLVGALEPRKITEFNGVKGYEWHTANGRVWLLWSLDGSTHSIPLPSTPRAIHDAIGASQPISNTVDVTLKPLYLEW